MEMDDSAATALLSLGSLASGFAMGEEDSDSDPQEPPRHVIVTPPPPPVPPVPQQLVQHIPYQDAHYCCHLRLVLKAYHSATPLLSSVSVLLSACTSEKQGNGEKESWKRFILARTRNNPIWSKGKALVSAANNSFQIKHNCNLGWESGTSCLEGPLTRVTSKPSCNKPACIFRSRR